MIIIQHIVTEWSKASRGGDAAGRRNRTPSTIKLPSIPAGVDVAVHRVDYRAVNEFAAAAKLSTDDRLPISVGCLRIKSLGDCLLISFRYSYTCGGAPERGWIRKDIRLLPGQWSQVEYNGRFRYSSGEWYYKHTVINIAIVDVAAPKIFTHTRPHLRFSAMALQI